MGVTLAYKLQRHSEPLRTDDDTGHGALLYLFRASLRLHDARIRGQTSIFLQSSRANKRYAGVYVDSRTVAENGQVDSYVLRHYSIPLALGPKLVTFWVIPDDCTCTGSPGFQVHRQLV